MDVAPTSLELPGQATASAFARVAGSLSDVRASLAALDERLRDLDRVLSDQRGNASVFEAVQAAARAVLATLDRAAAVAAPARVTETVRTALLALDVIEDRTIELRAVSTLTLVTARGLNVDVFDDYVKNLRALSTAMSVEARQLRDGVQTLVRRRGTASGFYAQASASLHQVTMVLEEMARERAETERSLAESRERTSALAERLPVEVAAETTTLVGAMQFADTVAQRLDRIGRIMARRPEVGPSAGALAAALIHALVDDMRETARTIDSSLTKVGGMAADATRALAGDAGSAGASPAASAIVLGRRVLAGIAEGAAGALSAIDGAATESGDLRTLSGEASGRFARVMEATKAIHLAAINAALLARLDDGRERALNVLSIEVQQQASACRRGALACKTTIEMLSNPEDLDAFAAVAPEAEGFRRSVAETFAAVEAAGSALQDIDRLSRAAVDSLDRLKSSIAVARQSVRSIPDAAAALARLAKALPQRPSPDAGSLPELMELYTMEREREVHRRLFGLPDPKAARAPMPAAAPDADPRAAILS